jgi:hypothetical protein
MIDHLTTLTALLRKGTQRQYRPYFVLLLILVVAGSALALGAAYPILSPFLYSMF